MMYHALVAVTLVLCASAAVQQINVDLVSKLNDAIAVSQKSIEHIFDLWDVKTYPNFLKSCTMTKLSWELLKLKFQARILESLEPSEAPAKFVISFTGSSVTAGHDSHFNFSTPVIVGNLMGPAFASMGITLHSRNVALGNNPCTPYDVCVKYFAGVDADIVHWEQTYFCEGQIVEQFIRQSMGMPSKPLVVFSDSNTAKWAKEDCKSGHINRTDPIDAEEQSLLAVDALHLVSEANKQLVSKSWKFMAPYMHAYHGAGIQLFSHRSEEDYACKGPFIPSFQDGAASWHPSVLGHSLRASHHAYFWLRAWSEALSDLRNQTSHRVVGAVQKDVVSRLGRLQAPRGKAQHKSDFPDDATCYTDYEPRPVREASLLSTVISGLASNTSNTTPTNGKGWTYQIYENIVNKELVEKSQQMQYLDYKYLLWGDKSAGPLSLRVNLKREGPIFICETPGIWGSLPKGFMHVWENADVYATYNVEGEEWAFKKELAVKLAFAYDKNHEICAKLEPAHKKGGVIPKGRHVLTVLGKGEAKIIIAWLITP